MCGTPADSAITAMSRVHERLNTYACRRAAGHVTYQRGRGAVNAQIGHYREWLKSADMALYKAKNAGRNRTEVAA
ncbi:adrA protein [Salmonella enterica subsp. enterica]|uniref:AdrA protein n=1 Tax=Salmonella enterica I TaxID=59201 RepID=A0A379WYP6_SALET|nr:adrA protein [Salmonella enterica subsp. enterica]